MNQLLNEHRFPDARAAEQSNLSALQKRLNQIDNLDPRLEHFQCCGLLIQQRRRPVNVIARGTLDRPELVHGLPEYVHHASQRRPAHGHADAFAEIHRPHPADQPFGWLHRNRTNPALA